MSWNDGSSGNIRAYVAGPIHASIATLARPADRQQFRTDGAHSFMRAVVQPGACLRPSVSPSQS